MRTSFVTVLVFVLVFICSFFVVGLGEGVIEEVEIREYEGEDLSSIEDFRENSILGPQYIDVETYDLDIVGLVENEIEFSYDEIVEGFKSVKKVVTLHCIEGWSVKLLWEGVLLEDIFNVATISPNASVVIFHAYDGYTTSLPLEYILDNRIILAYKMNNVTLPPERGFPFELVAESKYGYKWIKWITKIELSNDENFRGYWELRGYSNNADISLPLTSAPFPSPFATPIPIPTSTPTPTVEPANTPTPTQQPAGTPSSSPVGAELDIPLEYVAVGFGVFVSVVVLVFILRRK